MNPDNKKTAEKGQGRAPESAEPGLYRRWSRRKAEEAASKNGEGSPEAAAVDLERSDKEPAKELTDADMPPLETLNDESDYSGFLSPGVSETLRRAALRKLFRAERFNVIDGLDDYAEDYTFFEPLKDVVTSDMRHQVQRKLEKRKLEKMGEQEESMNSATAGEGQGAPPAEEPDPAARSEPDDTAEPAEPAEV